MSKKKLSHFAENLTFPNMFQPDYEELTAGFRYRGKWNEFFGNDKPILLELGCGKGEYTIHLAEKNPDRNYIGIDIKGARMWRGCKYSNEQKLNNAAFVRTHVQLISQVFAQKEVSGIWITFPDPHPQHSRQNKRLTAPRFLQIYASVISNDAVIRLKTDNRGLYDYTLEVIEAQDHRLVFKSDNLYQSEGPADALSVQTFYEQRWLAEGKKICYLEFQL